jgi:membrane associated rhomboid family serine protease
MKSGIYWISGLVLLAWMVELANMAQGHRLDEWGILPRTSRGLIGIPLSPFLHGGFGHVFSNTLPFVLLGGVVMMRGR